VPVGDVVGDRCRKMIVDGLAERDCSELVTLYRGQE
jgi:hypothetical protein